MTADGSIGAENRMFGSTLSIGGTPRAVVSVAGLKLPLAAVAFGCSVVFHGALFSVAYFTSWAPAVRTDPRIELPAGESAIQVRIFEAPWSEPEDEAEEHPPVDEDSRDYQPSLATTASVTVEAESLSTGEPESRPPSNNDEAGDADPAGLPPLPPGREEVSRSDVPADRQRLQEPDDDNGVEKPVTITEPGVANSPVRQEATRIDAVSLREAKRSDSPAEQKADEEPDHAETTQPSAVDPGVKSGVEVLHLPRPTYPLVSRRRGEQGVVLLQVEVLPSGRAGHIKVLSDPGYPRLTKSAIDAAGAAKFRPAIHNGEPVKDVVRIPFRFVLR